MTHDELLAKLSSSQVFGKQFGAKAYLALRAVVELHYPINGICNLCIGGRCDCCTGFESEFYPCPTIQAIEKAIE
jgi:hypothetical protein